MFLVGESMTKQIFEIEFIDDKRGFRPQLIGECLTSTKHLIAKIRITDITDQLDIDEIRPLYSTESNHKKKVSQDPNLLFFIPQKNANKISTLKYYCFVLFN